MDYKEIIDKIREKIGELNTDWIQFIYHRNKPFIQKDGIRYEIMTIDTPEEGDTTLRLTCIPSYSFKLVELVMDESWRITSWKKILKVVESEIDRICEEL